MPTPVPRVPKRLPAYQVVILVLISLVCVAGVGLNLALLSVLADLKQDTWLSNHPYVKAWIELITEKQLWILQPATFAASFFGLVGCFIKLADHAAAGKKKAPAGEAKKTK
ncbi:unnamed protein product [Pedinophyceae sp. YPF-701]|nr:unnamed protein product [Pedinophyceae sp. YPF-701]